MVLFHSFWSTHELITRQYFLVSATDWASYLGADSSIRGGWSLDSHAWFFVPGVKALICNCCFLVACVIVPGPWSLINPCHMFFNILNHRWLYTIPPGPRAPILRIHDQFSVDVNNCFCLGSRIFCCRASLVQINYPCCIDLCIWFLIIVADPWALVHGLWFIVHGNCCNCWSII